MAWALGDTPAEEVPIPEAVKSTGFDKWMEMKYTEQQMRYTQAIFDAVDGLKKNVVDNIAEALAVQDVKINGINTKLDAIHLNLQVLYRKFGELEVNNGVNEEHINKLKIENIDKKFLLENLKKALIDLDDRTMKFKDGS